MKDLLQKIGFSPKENTKEIFVKKYSNFNDYTVEVDFENQKFDYGNKITFESATTQNFSQAENWVVLECVDRLLSKGYKPEDIVLEKSYPGGHGIMKRLDILVKKDQKAYLMIECKTYEKEFEKEFARLQKDGGQLFTYFQQDTNADFLMLYTSKLNDKKIEYKNEIITIENHYRDAGNVEDFYNRWSKLTNQNGIFEDWVKPYHFENKALTKKNLEPLTEENSRTLFNRFASILRKYSISDKPNAFNKVFNLFLAKIFDEKKRDDDELDFQWKEKSDNPVDFQIRLINLHKDGMLEFLKKEIKGIENSDFNYKNEEELFNIKKKWLKFNNIFAIKDVIDDESFDDNQKVLKEVVELLQKYQIRYPKKQQHLSDFFERLLTTGLKQEAGQFFTPPPIARYIIKSIPIKESIEKNINNPVAKLPAVIDYAAGSGHFITEIMEEYQNIINKLETDNFYPDAIKEVKTWRQNEYSWAAKYIYGIEKDYRLVKVAKVGCYFYGDGLAQVIHSDGLDSFKNSKSYVGFLKQKEAVQDNSKFSFVISNPPYSVQHFKSDIKNKNPKESFNLFDSLTDQSKEIECLFVERTKQLLKEGGVAGIILPSSILSNTGIYTKTREIILKYFEIIGITKLGSNTFMETGTHTVILFLRRRNNYDWEKIKNSVDKFFTDFQDITVSGIENIFSKYVTHVWDETKFTDFVSLCQKSPNKTIQEHEIFVEYKKKLKSKNDEALYKQIIEIEKEKLLYFILAYKQKVVLTKTGEKKEEKQFLGYEFSNRRGYEGIHPIQRSKSIDECTGLFDPNTQENPEKASFYTYKNFIGEDFEINESMRENVSVIDLVDMMTFDRVDFEKNINLSVKKKIKIESNWNVVKIGEICKTSSGGTPTSGHSEYYENGKILWVNSGEVRNGVILDSEKKITELGLKKSSAKIFPKNTVLVAMYGATTGQVGILGTEASTNQAVCGILPNDNVNCNFLYRYLDTQLENFISLSYGVARSNISQEVIKNFKIPLPPKDIQEKIVKEIEGIEKKEEENKKKVEELNNEIDLIIENVYSNTKNKELLGNISEIKNGGTPNSSKSEYWNGGINWATLVDTKNKYLTKTARNISKLGLEKSSAVLLPINTVLFSSRATIGDVSITKIEVCTNQGYKNFICNSQKLHYEYLYYILKKEAKNIESLASGMTYPEISKTLISEYKIPLPPLPEQQKIVTKIEKIEQKIETLQSKIEKSKNQKEEVLKKYL